MDANDQPWLDALLDVRAYPHDPGRGDEVRRVDTHISHVFLTADRAYKLRRPVKLAFLDFSSPGERLADCLREVELNRRLAPDVYLGLAPVIVDEAGLDDDAKREAKDIDADAGGTDIGDPRGDRGGAARGLRVFVGPVGEAPSDDPRAVEYAVVMRRLEAGRDLRSMIERGEARAVHVDRVAEVLARFHASHGLGRPAPFAAGDWISRTTGPARANFDALSHAEPTLAPPAEVAEVRARAERFVEARRADFEERRLRGRVVDAHGDLHCEHVWFERDEAEPLLIDCLEFREDFRRIDAASDVAFLAMDLTYRGREDLAARFLRRYARASADYHLFSVVDYFLSYRAMVRAKVASLVAVDVSLPEQQRRHGAESTRRHLDLGLTFLVERPKGLLVLTCGSIGTGKTTVAEALADQVGGVVVSSDRVRRDPVLASDQPPRDSVLSPGAVSNVEDRAARDGYAASNVEPGMGHDSDAASNFEHGMGHDSDTASSVEHGGGRYSQGARAAVYERALEEARHIVLSGRAAILDATFSRRAWRETARAWARMNADGCFLVEVEADEDDVRARLAARTAAANDASEAGPGLYDAMRAEFEKPDEWPSDAKARINTSSMNWRAHVEAVAARIVRR